MKSPEQTKRNKFGNLKSKQKFQKSFGKKGTAQIYEVSFRFCALQDNLLKRNSLVKSSFTQ
jgi:hypothetical protein